jgi:nucleoside-diphosphate-sugar epimerase
MARALVTGATGFIGGHIVVALLAAGHEVTALVRPSSDTCHLRDPRVRVAFGDVTEPASLCAAMRGIRWVYHTAAAVGSYGRWEHFRRVGVDGTANVIDAASSARVDRFIHFSSIVVYGTRKSGSVFDESYPFDDTPEPWNHYVREKVLAERILWEAHARGQIRATCLRPSVVVGPRDRNVVGRTLAIVGSRLRAIPGNPRNQLPAVVVEELASTAVRAAESHIAVGRAYNLSSASTITVSAFMGAFAQAAGRRPATRALPTRAALVVAGALERVHQLMRRPDEPFLTRIAVAIAGYDCVIDCARARAELGWHGRADLMDAIGRSVAWHQRAGRGQPTRPVRCARLTRHRGQSQVLGPVPGSTLRAPNGESDGGRLANVDEERE